MFEEVFSQLTNRSLDSNKYDFGHVLILGGAPGMVGAPMLCAIGALRTGAGLVTVASSSEVVDKLEKRVLEIMTLRLAGDATEQTRILAEFVAERRVSVLAAGPGFDENHVGILKTLLPEINIPIILDAGALTCFAGNLEALRKITSNNSQVICTPHQGEFEKLTGISLSQDLEERKHQVESVAKENQLTVVCKGSPTIVVSPSGDDYVNETGNPGMATAGTGDVLAGVIAGLVAQGIDISSSAKAGVHLHGLAGNLASEAKTQPGMIASDLFEYIPNAIKNILKAQ